MHNLEEGGSWPDHCIQTLQICKHAKHTNTPKPSTCAETSIQNVKKMRDHDLITMRLMMMKMRKKDDK